VLDTDRAGVRVEYLGEALVDLGRLVGAAADPDDAQ
jgi:hypothetical protein